MTEISTMEAAALLGITRTGVMKLIARGHLSARNEAGRLRLDSDQVKALKSRTCPNCGKAFKPARVDQLYCGRPCTLEANYKRWKARQAAGTKPPPRPLDLSNPRLATVLKHIGKQARIKRL